MSGCRVALSEGNEKVYVCSMRAGNPCVYSIVDFDGKPIGIPSCPHPNPLLCADRNRNGLVIVLSYIIDSRGNIIAKTDRDLNHYDRPEKHGSENFGRVLGASDGNGRFVAGGMVVGWFLREKNGRRYKDRYRIASATPLN